MKQQVRLTESELKAVIKEAVNNILMEYGDKPETRYKMAHAAKRSVNNGDASAYNNAINSLTKRNSSKHEMSDFQQKFEENTQKECGQIGNIEEEDDAEFNEQPTNDVVGESVKITESQLKDIIKESVLRILNEGQGWNLFKNTYNDVKNGEYDDWLDKGGFTDDEKLEYDKEKQDYINHAGYSEDEPFYDEKGHYSYNNQLGDNKKVNNGLLGKLGRKAGIMGSEALMNLRKRKLGIK